MKRIFTILIILNVILAALLIIWNRDENQEDGIIIMQDEKETVISFSEIDRLPKHSFTTSRGDNFSGFLLSDLLQDYSFSKIKLHSADGGSLKLEDYNDMKNAYIIDMDTVEEKAFRLIIPSDKFGQRWMKYIKTIEVK